VVDDCEVSDEGLGFEQGAVVPAWWSSGRDRSTCPCLRGGRRGEIDRLAHALCALRPDLCT
jgi:hypothetical protein